MDLLHTKKPRHVNVFVDASGFAFLVALAYKDPGD
jgi:hypothetical protein